MSRQTRRWTFIRKYFMILLFAMLVNKFGEWSCMPCTFKRPSDFNGNFRCSRKVGLCPWCLPGHTPTLGVQKNTKLFSCIYTIRLTWNEYSLKVNNVRHQKMYISWGITPGENLQINAGFLILKNCYEKNYRYIKKQANNCDKPNFTNKSRPEGPGNNQATLHILVTTQVLPTHTPLYLQCHRHAGSTTYW